MFHAPGLGQADMIHCGSVGRYIQVEFGVGNAINEKICQNCAHTETIRLKLTCHRRYPRIHMLGSNLFTSCYLLKSSTSEYWSLEACMPTVCWILRRDEPHARSEVHSLEISPLHRTDKQKRSSDPMLPPGRIPILLRKLRVPVLKAADVEPGRQQQVDVARRGPVLLPHAGTKPR